MLLLRRFVLALALSAIGAAAHATPPESTFAERLPRAWCGTFRWDGDARARGADQHVTIVFNRVELRADGKVEANGPGLVRAWRTVRFHMRAVFDPATRRVEMFESEPSEPEGYVTDGSHVGEIAADLGAMRLAWSTNGTDARGRLELLARPPHADLAQPCAPPSS